MVLLQGGRVQVVALIVLNGALLLIGYQAGRTAGSARGTFLAAAPVEPEGTPGTHSEPDFQPEKLGGELIERLTAARVAASASPWASLATPGGVEVQERLATELHESVSKGITGLKASFSSEHAKLIKALDLLGASDESVAMAYSALLPEAANKLGSTRLMKNRTNSSSQALLLSVVVSEKPFGMYIKRGTTLVEEVFPGFLAAKAGVRKGCELKEVAGQEALPGTWLERFQQSPLPFQVRLSCGGRPTPGGALEAYPRQYRVMVTRKPYGMNIQVNRLPRVVEVLPGYPAEAAGIQRGFVLTEVNEAPVNAENWFQEYQSAELPFTMTFDTNVPVQESNPFFKEEPADAVAPPDEPVPGDGYVDFKCTVEKLPFGMQVKALPHRRPVVASVVVGSLAEKQGVLAGDVLVSVAGRDVNYQSWFSAMQQAVPPFGLLLRRPASVAAATAAPAHVPHPAGDPQPVPASHGHEHDHEHDHHR